MKDLCGMGVRVRSREQRSKSHKKSKKKGRVVEKYSSHPNFTCDHCKNNKCIVGVRFSCKVGVGVASEV